MSVLSVTMDPLPLTSTSWMSEMNIVETVFLIGLVLSSGLIIFMKTNYPHDFSLQVVNCVEIGLVASISMAVGSGLYMVFL